MKILAVDDDSSILELLPLIAERAGFSDIRTATSAEMALDMMTEDGVVYDCLMFDINMPEIDGIQLCTLARKIHTYSKTPIIMLTAMTEKSYIDRAFKAGATDYVNKPFDIVELGARLRMMEELVSARKEAAAAASSAAGLDTAKWHNFCLADEVPIEDIEQLIGCKALGNYLTQLSRAGLASSQVLAVKIDRIEMIYAQASTEEFLYALTEVANAIVDAMRSNNFLIAYAGNGVFLVVSGQSTLEPSVELESEIQALLDDKNTEYDSGEPLDIEVSIGNPIRPNQSRKQRVRKTFDRAVARAENRAQKKLNEPRSLNIRMIGG